MRNQKNALTDIRVVFGGSTILRDKNSEAVIIGKQLPLNHRDADDFVEHWTIYLSALEHLNPIIRAELINFIESTVSFIAE
jgi:hypothetical protein